MAGVFGLPLGASVWFPTGMRCPSQCQPTVCACAGVRHRGEHSQSVCGNQEPVPGASTDPEGEVKGLQRTMAASLVGWEH